MKRISSVLFVRIFWFLVLSPLYGEDTNQSINPWEKPIPESIQDLDLIQKKIQEKMQKVVDAVVCVEAEDGAGSGVVVSAEGLILTAAHVIGNSGRTMKVTFADGRNVDAISLGGSELSDAGMLKIIESGEWNYVPMSPAHLSKLGDWCFALGHPNGFDPKRGMVLRIGRIIYKQDETMQTDCRLLGGDSGGPLFSVEGNVIGIHSRISQDPEDNFHIPIESFLSNWEYFLNENLHTFNAMQTGGFLGVQCEETDLGLRILKVIQNTPAEKSGLIAGDILKCLNGDFLDTREKLTLLVSSKPPGSEITLDCLRDEKEILLRVTLGTRNLDN